MYNYSSANINDADTERQLSQEFSSQSYYDLRPVPLPTTTQSTIDIDSRKLTFSFVPSMMYEPENFSFKISNINVLLFLGDPLPSRQRDSTVENHRPTNESPSAVLHSTTNNQNNCAPLATLTGECKYNLKKNKI